MRTPVAEPPDGDFWHRWAARVARHPWLHLAGGLALIAVLAAPLAAMRLGDLDAGAQSASSTERRAYDLISAGFGPGANGTITVVAQLDSQQIASPAQAQNLAGTGATGYVTGVTAAALAFTDTLAARLPLIIAVVAAAVVAAAAFLLLLAVFRSPLVALKAAVLNLCSIGAAYGVIVAVFQWGWGGSLLGVGQRVPIESYVPMMMFSIVFGLSMDYEVFLLSRIRESWLERGDNHLAVASGIAATARVITCAALIMTSVFLAFLLSPNVVVKMLALGLGVSVVIDATVVRLLLVPALMFLLGRANWWIPRWLDAILPRLDAEGPAEPVPASASAATPHVASEG